LAKALVRLTDTSEADLLDIWHFIAASSPAAADRVVRDIGRQIARLADFPEIGARRADIAPEVRALVVGSYLALYRFDGATAEIVRVVHGARDLGEII
jgi:toxin ParE1/3/4